MKIVIKIDHTTHEDVIDCLGQAGLAGAFGYEDDITLVVDTLDIECEVQKGCFTEACFNLAVCGLPFEVVTNDWNYQGAKY